MIVDVTPLARAVRRLDVSATLGSFVPVVAFLLLVTNLTSIYLTLRDSLDFMDLPVHRDLVVIAAAIASLLALLAPFSLIWLDWLKRRPSWRYVDAFVGALVGAAGAVAAGVALAGIAFIVEEMNPQIAGLGAHRIVQLAGAVLLGLCAALLVSRAPRTRRVLGGALLALLLAGSAAILAPMLREVLAGSGDLPPAREVFAELAVFAVSVPLGVWLVVRTLRNRLVLSADRPRELLLGALPRKQFGARLAFLAGLPSSLWYRGALLTLPLWLFLAARPLVYGGVVALRDVLASDKVILVALTGVALVLCGHLVFYGAKRLAARRIWSPRRPRDARAPILFLRSFADDQLRFTRPKWDLVNRWLDLWSFRRNADETLIDEVARYGPVVALGRPGETATPFGASRYYSSDDDWQDIISDTARNAQAIVIGAGDTPGVRWEYELLARERLLDRTLLLFPSQTQDRAQAHRALANFCDATGTKNAFDIPAGAHPIALLPGAGGPTLVTADAPAATAYLVAIRAFFQSCPATVLVDPLTDYSRGPDYSRGQST